MKISEQALEILRETWPVNSLPRICLENERFRLMSNNIVFKPICFELKL